MAFKRPIKLPKDTQGVEYYPATTTDAVVHPTIRKSVTEIIDDINTSGVPIVDSVDDLNPNAPQGSLTSVAVNEMIDIVETFSIKEISVHNETYPEVINELNVSVPETFTEENITVLFSLPELTDVETNNHISVSTNYDEVGDGSVINKLSATITAAEETTILTLIDSEGVLNEESVETLNSTIENWGGVVLYGVKGEADITEPTEDQYGVLDSFFGYDYTVQEQGDNYTNLYIKEQNEWVRRNDVKIVDSVDKLDPNAPQGSLASVAVNTGGEVPFSELYQPTSDEVNLETGVVDTTNLSSINGISVNSSFDTSAEIQDFQVNLFSKDIDMQGGVGQAIILYPEGAITINLSTQEQNGFELFVPNEDDTITVNEENLATINNLLSTTEFVYGGVLGVPFHADVFYKGIIKGTKKTELYIKDVEGWNHINKDVDVVPLIDSVDKLDPNAKQGSLVSVVVNTIGEVPFSKLYQPTSDEVNMGADVIDTTKLSSISGISINSSYDTSAEIPYFEIYLFSKDIDMQGGVGQAIDLTLIPEGGLGIATIMNLETQEQQELELITSIEDGIITVNKKNLAIINNLLSSTEFVYGGVMNGGGNEFIDPSYTDMFCNSISGIQKTDLYIKDVEGWGPVEDKKIKEQIDNLQTIVDNLEDKTDLIVNSVDELPEDAPIGSLASVLDLYPIESESYFSNINTKRILKVNVVTSNSGVSPYSGSLELSAIDGSENIILNFILNDATPPRIQIYLHI